MAVPAELMAALQGAGGAPPPQGGLPPEAAAPPDQGQGGLYGAAAGGGAEPLKAALDALQAYAQGEDDESHIQTVLKCITALQGILAEEQKMSDGLMSGKSDPRALRMFGGAQG